MKIVLSLIFFSFCFTSVQGQFSYDKSRIEKIRWSPKPIIVNGIDENILDLNGQWHFSANPQNDFYKNTDQKEWNKIEVPGEWVMQGFDVDAGSAAGYFKTFNVSKSWKGYRIKLKCEAVYSKCNIWINGKELDSHLGGFTPFEFDVTDWVQSGKNTIALEVRSESLADTLSSGSKYAVHPLGGISRSIYLMALPEVNLASYHVNTQFDENYEDANLGIEITIINESSKIKKTSFEFTLSDSNGNTIEYVGNRIYNLVLNQAEKKKFEASLKVINPLKWDCEHPNLYHLKCKILVDEKEVKTVNKRFGFRQIDVRGNQVFVNNRPIKLRGVCRHEVDPLRGRSLTGNQWYEDVKLFKEGNVNYIRTSHYPPDEKLLEACDELGIFVEEEAPFCWARKDQVTDDNYFEAILQPTLEMIERDKSHPSIIQWSLANESHNFIELFQTSADLVKEADPSRPRIFSQWKPDGDEGYLEIANFHYPGSSGPEKYSKNERPITFDEYCHLNAYNRFELMTDPGIRDFWGRILYNMWEQMYVSSGVLGGALWAGIDDSFFLPSGQVVGYGTWGPIDGWRRPKPEYWHMKKTYSPVKIKLLEDHPDSLVKIEVQNRYLFSNLNECTIKWKNGEQIGKLSPNIDVNEKKEISLPIKNKSLEKLTIEVWNKMEVAVDKYVFDFSKPEIVDVNDENDTFSYVRQKDYQIAKSKNLEILYNKTDLIIKNVKGDKVVKGWPVLMLVALNNGGDTQMTKMTPDYGLFSPKAKNRKIESITVNKQKSLVEFTVTDSYEEALGKTTINVSAAGHVNIEYAYTARKELNLRQWGVSMTLPKSFSNLYWKRKGLWTTYPENHIGRLEGNARLFYEHLECGLAGPAKRPGWPYSEDQTRYGSNDYRSTKRNILNAALRTENNTEIKIKSGGNQHLRCWTDNDAIHVLLAEYDNPGAERFIRGYADHVSKYDTPIKFGELFSGEINIEIK